MVRQPCVQAMQGVGGLAARRLGGLHFILSKRQETSARAMSDIGGRPCPRPVRASPVLCVQTRTYTSSLEVLALHLQFEPLVLGGRQIRLDADQIFGRLRESVRIADE